MCLPYRAPNQGAELRLPNWTRFSIAKSIVSPDTDDEVTGIRWKLAELPPDSTCHAAVNSPQRRPPTAGQTVAQLLYDIRPACNIGGVVEYRVSEKDQVAHRRVPISKVETGWAQVQCFANLSCFGYLRRSEVFNPARAFK